MVTVAAAGVSPLEFYRMTVGEVMVVVEGYNERERASLIGRIAAITRALSKGDPLEGLRGARRSAVKSIKSATQRWLWGD